MLTIVRTQVALPKRLLSTATAEATAEKWLKLLGEVIKPTMCCRVMKPSRGSWQLLMLHACTL
jgi:hypothetical protein